MTNFEKEMREFLKDDGLLAAKVFCDKVVLGELNENVNVKISFHNYMQADKYYGFLVEIINKVTGKIDAQTFKFGDIVGKFKMGGDELNPYIWVYRNDVSWYGVALNATHKKKIMRVIYDYIALYS